MDFANPTHGLTDADFQGLRGLVHEWAGISLSEAKRALLAGRLAKRLRMLGLATYGEYLRLLNSEAGAPERTEFINAIATNETHFFRERPHFDLLESTFFPQLRANAVAGRSKRLRIWSAACSTGEEPYSLAICALANLPASEGWSIEILATDISTKVLAQARAGIWQTTKTASIGEGLRKRFMLRGVGEQDGYVAAGNDLRDIITFRHFNLNTLPYSVGEPFDLIFCRNVLIYFDANLKNRVVAELLQHLTPAGLFFVGHAESLAGMGLPMRTIIPTVYSKREVTFPP